MGQQQLLLLVLSTVIVGLATVAGIQAFSENQEQATQDALVQRGLDIMSEIKAVSQKPTQLGGVDYSNSPTGIDLATAAGMNTETDGNGNTVLPAEAAGNAATCSFGGNSVSSPDDLSSLVLTCETGGGDQSVTIEFDSNGEITTSV